LNCRKSSETLRHGLAGALVVATVALQVELRAKASKSSGAASCDATRRSATSSGSGPVSTAASVFVVVVIAVGLRLRCPRWQCGALDGRLGDLVVAVVEAGDDVRQAHLLALDLVEDASRSSTARG
jgi:hypothetical protein